MADDKRGREKQARNESDRQARRRVREAIERGSEPEPQLDEGTFGDVEAALADVSFPATGAEVVAAVEDPVAVDGERMPVAALLPENDAERFPSAAAVRDRLRYPTVATAMKRVVEAAGEHQGVDLRGSQREAYETTFLALAAIDELDDDEGVVAVADWIVDRLETTGKLPGSRRVRKQAAKISREHGYEIRDDEWLGA